jgi:hypothetical protein
MPERLAPMLIPGQARVEERWLRGVRMAVGRPGEMER